MTPQSFLSKYKYISKIEYDPEFHRCWYTRSDDGEEMASTEFRGGAFTDSMAVDKWATKNCTEKTEWHR
jgi:hypothetical protein